MVPSFLGGNNTVIKRAEGSGKFTSMYFKSVSYVFNEIRIRPKNWIKSIHRIQIKYNDRSKSSVATCKTLQ